MYGLHRSPGMLREPNELTPDDSSRVRPHFPEPYHSREILLSRLLLLVTVIFTVILCYELFLPFGAHVEAGDFSGLAAHSVFMGITGALLYGSFIYQLCRLGYMKRHAEHRPAATRELFLTYQHETGELVILVPSYKEEVEVVRRSLMSAALQDYPIRQIVLLIDDPPQPINIADVKALQATRQLPCELERLFCAAAKPFLAAHQDFMERKVQGSVRPSDEMDSLARLHRQACDWLQRQERLIDANDGAELLFRDIVLRECQGMHTRRTIELESLMHSGGLGLEEISAEYYRLAQLFQVNFSSFERKHYVNLSHESNKAMNINSYIGLMGSSFRQVLRSGGLYLETTSDSADVIKFPDAEFVVILDADSLLMPDYALRLVHLMRQPGHERTAVAQTPYNSVPTRPRSLEYVAGATTDIQHLIHQGFTRYHATYWVGANALVRKAALEDIATTQFDRGFEVKMYIQDRTVIEDTESTIDLIDHGWELYNYPQRLAYSATPSDFGALLIQRRRWANGGLIILPKLVRYLLRGKGTWARLVEGFFRVHYLISIGVVNVGLLIALVFTFDHSVRSILWLALAAAPYFFLYARDLAQVGYQLSDVFRVYALNLMLIPVNLGGLFKSLHQAATGRKIPFVRTPKIAGRTAVPLFYLLAEYGLLICWLVGVSRDLLEKRWEHAFFGLANSAFLAFAIYNYIGLRESREDILAALKQPNGNPGKEPIQMAAHPHALLSRRFFPPQADDK